METPDAAPDWGGTSGLGVSVRRVSGLWAFGCSEPWQENLLLELGAVLLEVRCSVGVCSAVISFHGQL